MNERPTRAHAFAYADVASARAWYEAQRPNLGAEFSAYFYRTLAAIEANPTAQAPATPPFRRRRLQRFLYGVFFEWDGAVALVLAVIHRHRSPEFIAEQLQRKG